MRAASGRRRAFRPGSAGPLESGEGAPAWWARPLSSPGRVSRPRWWCGMSWARAGAPRSGRGAMSRVRGGARHVPSLGRAPRPGGAARPGPGEGHPARGAARHVPSPRRAPRPGVRHIPSPGMAPRPGGVRPLPGLRRAPAWGMRPAPRTRGRAPRPERGAARPEPGEGCGLSRVCGGHPAQTGARHVPTPGRAPRPGWVRHVPSPGREPRPGSAPRPGNAPRTGPSAGHPAREEGGPSRGRGGHPAQVGRPVPGPGQVCSGRGGARPLPSRRRAPRPGWGAARPGPAKVPASPVPPSTVGRS